MADPIRTFRHYSEVPERIWRWKNFSPAEIACRGTGQLKLVPEAMDRLQELRDLLVKPLIVRSAYRSPEHNRAVGGAKASKHMDGMAFDIAMANHEPTAFEAAAREVGFLGFGYYPRSGFMHIDLGPARSWGEKFPVCATAFAAETPPAREVLAESRTLKGAGAAGVATVGAAGVEVAQDILAEAQGAVLPLVSHLDTMRWLFIALALGGIAVAVWARIDDWKGGAAVMWGSLPTGILARPWALRVAAFALAALTIALFILNLRSAGERAGRAAERLENLEHTHDIQRQMLDAASRRPRDRDDLVERLRKGGF